MCTNFYIRTKKNEMVIGRTLEFALDVDSDIFFRKPGYRYSQDIRKILNQIQTELQLSDKQLENFQINAETPDAEQLYSWEGKYGFVAMGSLGQSFATNGLNTQGLTTGTMTLAQSEYQPFVADKNSKTLLYPCLTNWILSNCSTCQDVIDALDVRREDICLSKESTLSTVMADNGEDKLRVSNPFTGALPPGFHFHMPIQDKLGHSIVLEYTHGRLTITDLMPIGVLTNDPVIGWQQENVINNYMNITPINIQSLNPNAFWLNNNFACETVAQGSGFTGLPGSSAPVDRFVRASMMTNFAFQTDDTVEATNLAFHILNTVDIPDGTSREHINSESGNGADRTLWATVSDLTHQIYSIRMYGSPQVFKIDLKKLDLEALNDVRYRLPVREHQSIDVTNNIMSQVTISKEPQPESV
ncbi:linear amide C-N hydrolase [Vibrio sp. ZSDZ65]|uniref:Linear amide C-N hydrolase n=1 Tax=Vibrio qingdaonensis TaxID=2829491 RepID=A0A9X3CLL6_9VIBR|nr:linear amide C-N hydrolase [Vibrio qingdaonensis]MCW8345444.1 linear amide C-N hydrolase [Vibrio qingdaonensis]